MLKTLSRKRFASSFATFNTIPAWSQNALPLASLLFPTGYCRPLPPFDRRGSLPQDTRPIQNTENSLSGASFPQIFPRVADPIEPFGLIYFENGLSPPPLDRCCYGLRQSP